MPDPIGSTGWQLVSDPESRAVRLEHVDSGRSYVLDDAGGVREPGGDGAGKRRTTETIESSQEDGTTMSRSGVDTQAETSTETCTVQCNETTGEAVIHGATAISVDAPVVDVSARKRVDVSSGGGVNITGEEDS